MFFLGGNQQDSPQETLSMVYNQLALAVIFLEQISGASGPKVGSSWPQCELRLLRVATGLALATNLNLHQPRENHW